jgi:hypothetical protein
MIFYTTIQYCTLEADLEIFALRHVDADSNCIPFPIYNHMAPS